MLRCVNVQVYIGISHLKYRIVITCNFYLTFPKVAANFAAVNPADPPPTTRRSYVEEDGTDEGVVMANARLANEAIVRHIKIVIMAMAAFAFVSFITMFIKDWIVITEVSSQSTIYCFVQQFLKVVPVRTVQYGGSLLHVYHLNNKAFFACTLLSLYVKTAKIVLLYLVRHKQSIHRYKLQTYKRTLRHQLH